MTRGRSKQSVLFAFPFSLFHVAIFVGSKLHHIPDTRRTGSERGRKEIKEEEREGERLKDRERERGEAKKGLV